MTLRFHLPPGGDVPPSVAARRMGMTLEEFRRALAPGPDAATPSLLQRGFPPPDPTTGNFDLDAIDAWRRARYPQLFRLTGESHALNARDVVPGTSREAARWVRWRSAASGLRRLGNVRGARRRRGARIMTGPALARELAAYAEGRAD